MSEPEPQQSGVTVKTGLGSLSVLGNRSGEIACMLSLVCVVLVAYMTWDHARDSDIRFTARAIEQKLFVTALHDLARAHRLLACLMSLPQERREEEFRSATGMCKQMERMQ
jgi:hypothetical protein